MLGGGRGSEVSIKEHYREVQSFNTFTKKLLLCRYIFIKIDCKKLFCFLNHFLPTFLHTVCKFGEGGIAPALHNTYGVWP